MHNDSTADRRALLAAIQAQAPKWARTPQLDDLQTDHEGGWEFIYESVNLVGDLDARGSVIVKLTAGRVIDESTLQFTEVDETVPHIHIEDPRHGAFTMQELFVLQKALLNLASLQVGLDLAEVRS